MVEYFATFSNGRTSLNVVSWCWIPFCWLPSGMAERSSEWKSEKDEHQMSHVLANESCELLDVFCVLAKKSRIGQSES